MKEKQTRIDGGEDVVLDLPDGGPLEQQRMLFPPALQLPKVVGEVIDPLGTMTLEGVDDETL